MNDNKNKIAAFFHSLFGGISGRVSKYINDTRAVLKEFSLTPFVKSMIGNIKDLSAASARSVQDILKDFVAFLRKKESEGIRLGLWVFFIMLIMFVLIGVTVLFEVSDRWDKRSRSIVVPKGYGANQVADLLMNGNLISNRYGFNLIVNVFNLHNKIQAGTYSFNPKMPLVQIVWKLSSGDVVPVPKVKLVFPEGISIYNIGEVMKERNVASGNEFKKYADSPVSDLLKSRFSFLKEVTIDSLEGYLFPDTYLVPPDIGNGALLDLMLSRFASVVLPFWGRSKNDTKYSMHEILTLASIIEKEAAVPEEREIISSVFHNRLKRGIKLAADPTVKYALSPYRKPTKKVYWIDLEVDSPYNTYKYEGLPPGPICSPGFASIKAAVYPAKTDYYYFVARPDGTHIFSTNWRDHEKAKEMVRKMR